MRHDSSHFTDISARLLDENAEICPQFREFVFTGWDRHAEVTSTSLVEIEIWFKNYTFSISILNFKRLV